MNSRSILFLPNNEHEKLNILLERYDVSLETYQLGQILTRSMLFQKNDALGGWLRASNPKIENQFADEAVKLNWKEKIELASKIKNDWLIDHSKKFPKVAGLYGDETVYLKGISAAAQILKNYYSYKKDLEVVGNIKNIDNLKLITNSEFIRKRNSMIEKVRKSLEFSKKKKFIRNPIIDYNEKLGLFIYYPENHPYFREWLLYNYAFWSPFFKSRTLLTHEDPSNIKTIKSRELARFLAEKFKHEHSKSSFTILDKYQRPDLSVVVDEKPLEVDFFSESNILDLLDSSFFRRDNLDRVYNSCIIDRNIIAFAIESWEPFKDYKNILISPKSIKAVDILIATKNNKKVA